MTEPSDTEPPARRRRRVVPEPEPYPRSFWPAVVIGALLMAVGVRGLLANSADTQPVRWVVIFLASAVIHDVILAPLVIAAGWLLSRRLGPTWLRAPLQGALICSGIVILVAFPLVRGYGLQSGNETILPLNYGRGLLIVLAVIWVGTAVAVAVLRFRRAGASRRFVDSLGSDIERIDAGAGTPVAPDAALSIAGHALLSDCQGAALVDRTGTITWACLPRFDSASCFGRLLGDDAGHWRIGPTGSATVNRGYLDGTMVLRTVFTTPSGTVAVTDALALDPEARVHAIGQDSPHVLIRVVEGLAGDVDVELELALRPEYGLATPRLVRHGHGVRAPGGARAYVIASAVDLTLDGGTARAAWRVSEGDITGFAMAAVSPADPAPAPMGTQEALFLLEGTVEGWRSWSKMHQRYDGPHAELVHHGGRVLRALTHVPTGALVAAPTTSLPEIVGGDDNWDDRLTRLADAGMAMEALSVAACPDEPQRFFDFFLNAASDRSTLQPLYGIRGERRLAEDELDHLEGYRGSQPVRIGTDGGPEVHLGVYGELLGAAWVVRDQLADRHGALDPATAGLLVDMADLAARRWRRPDTDTWGRPGPNRHYLHSKLLCWVALERAVDLAPQLRTRGRGHRWERSREEIRTSILGEGWDEGLGAYSAVVGEAELDASLLLMPIVGFLPGDDERMRATIEAVARHLTDEEGLVRRYDGDGGGPRSTCSFWLVHCLALLGELDRAEALFTTVVSHANDVGLLADGLGAQGELFGNFPHTASHASLVNAVAALGRARAELEGEADGEGQVPASSSPAGGSNR